MQLHVGVLLAAAVLILQLASAQAMRCHQCKGFGGCSHVARCPGDSTHCIAIATRDLITFKDLPLVTKMCHRGCPDIQSLGLGPHVSIICCQASLCNHD
ncbi:PREDICTED: ly-6/neurotoxin-like protein 1 [Propithecus coquereli]|uniref:Secreted Ly-6/uPAR domain-containing protein 2 n=1 Tax=Propithecus coquereli TaxID=379532 RepID=A0A2K6F191_PROCO|nr:PREDICTED: ly-6/neurotoxin-like protein 1 [Propithecus coquereli]